MYGIVSVLGSILRQIYFPNPFINSFSTQGIADLFNLFIGGTIIGCLAYLLTGFIYESGEAPIIGSILYTINYAIISFSFYGITLLIKNIIISVIIFLILYIIACILLSKFRNEF